MEDTEIIRLYFARNETAITETAGKYGSYLHTVAYHILRQEEDTEEILSDTYLGAWNAIPPAVPAVLRHFLSRITRNLSLKKLSYLGAEKRAAEVTVRSGKNAGKPNDSQNAEHLSRLSYSTGGLSVCIPLLLCVEHPGTS